MPVKPIPDGYHTVTPYLIVNDAAKAIEFYKQAFGATEMLRFPDRLPLQGGLPIMHEGECVGGIGVSGVQSHEDEEVAAAGLAGISAGSPHSPS